jgi:hypothetical protein
MPSALVQEALERLDDGWSLGEVEWFIDDLRLDDGPRRCGCWPGSIVGRTT